MFVVYYKILVKSPLLKGDVIEDDRGIQLNNVSLTRIPPPQAVPLPFTREAKLGKAKQNRLCVSVAVLRMLRGLLGGIATCCIPLICVAPSLLKEGGPLAVGGFYGAVLLQLERMAQPRRVYGVIC